MKIQQAKEAFSRMPARLCGEWIKKPSGYENGLCNEIGWYVDKGRYHDATCGGFKIEIKKGNIWLDLVRYSEILLGKGESDTITAFFIKSKDNKTIEYIYFVDTKDIIKKLNISENFADMLLDLESLVPHSLNAQTSLSKKDVMDLAFHCHKFKIGPN